MSFKLSEAFIEEYKGKQPKWGPLGYFVYKRTYARKIDETGTTEEFWQTAKRVVETVYTFQKRHCDSLRLPWNNTKAQKSAQEMFRRMWDFKFLPPGRGLWAADVGLIDAKGSACVNNCAFVSTNELATSFAAPYTFAMDMLMLGVGVGADTAGAGTITIKEPKYTSVPFVVEDSREGWISLVETVLNSFVGIGAYPDIIDVSKVRKEGEPIKTFGGTSSGPSPLLILIDDIQSILTRYKAPAKITTDQITDLFNVIGKCVVSGNVRRSAELMLGSPKDEVFKSLKQDKERLMEYRWASNNSLSVAIGDDYTDGAVATASNGEPGYVWLGNAQAFSRMKDSADYKDKRVLGVNP